MRSRNRIIGICKACEKTFEFIASRSAGMFCSKPCEAKFKIDETNKRIELGLVSHPARLKRYLADLFGESCVECKQGSTWNNTPLTLQLDHIDGNSDNNLPNNLRLLCPNCHSQTKTFSGRNCGKVNSTRSSYMKAYRKIGRSSRNRT